jgi:hypothetical protein
MVAAGRPWCNGHTTPRCGRRQCPARGRRSQPARTHRRRRSRPATGAGPSRCVHSSCCRASIAWMPARRTRCRRTRHRRCRWSVPSRRPARASRARPRQPGSCRAGDPRPSRQRRAIIPPAEPIQSPAVWGIQQASDHLFDWAGRFTWISRRANQDVVRPSCEAKRHAMVSALFGGVGPRADLMPPRPAPRPSSRPPWPWSWPGRWVAG